MKEYIVDLLNKTFEKPKKIQANSPKEAVEKVIGKTAKRVTHGGNIVVGVWNDCRNYARYTTYLYETQGE